MSRAALGVWTVLTLVAVSWPSPMLSWLDGLPLNQRGEAVLLGVGVPALWWLDRGFLRTPVARLCTVLLLLFKGGATLTLAQQGLCAKFSTTDPMSGEIQTIPMNEPTGVLRSWDVRADWRSGHPACTAVVDRAYRTEAQFPAWFLNIVEALHPQRAPISMEVTGFVTVHEPGVFALEAAQGVTGNAVVGSQSIVLRSGTANGVDLGAGVYRIAVHARLADAPWRFAPLWNGQDAWRRVRMTVAPPRARDRLASALSVVTDSVVLVLLGSWGLSAVHRRPLTLPMIGWMMVMIPTFALWGCAARFERAAPVLLLASMLVPVAARHRNVRGAFLLIGLPWLAFFVGTSLGHIGTFTRYSVGDDWLTFQVAGYRIFMWGYWLEGGSQTFYFQALYRWICGGLHVVFGDSSVGELYWDAACLLGGALLAFHVAKTVAGFRWGLAAAVATLATWTLSPIWYLIGRGLSDISGAGFGFLAIFFVLRSRLGRLSVAGAAGAFATLMVYTRLNHLGFAVSLVAFLLPLRAGTYWRDLGSALRRIRTGSLLTYVACLSTGLLLFAWRTWWYTGTFSVLHGTSVTVNTTGLSIRTLGNPTVWGAIRESLLALVWMNEPPSPDPRAAFLVVGFVCLVGAFAQLPGWRRLPLGVGVACVGGIAASFVAHAHHYPGRWSVHLVPLTTATAISGLAMLWRARTSPRHEPGSDAA